MGSSSKIKLLRPFLAFCLLVTFTFPLFAAESLRETPVVSVVKTWAPSIVNISTEKIAFLRRQPFWGDYGDAYDNFFKEFYGHVQHVQAVKLRSVGSGVVIRKEGLIVTNAHVVNMANKVYVIFQNGKTVEGKVVLLNQRDDLAFVKIDPPFPVNPVSLANADDIMIGETVISIGNPYGIGQSVSTGVVSGVKRFFSLPYSSHVFSGLIQTDASINVGSSGGALLNLDGELVGINLAIIQNSQNVGFAVSPQKIKEGIDFYDTQQQIKDIQQNAPRKN